MLMDRIPCSVLLCDDSWTDGLVLSVRKSANASGWEPSWGVKRCCRNGAGVFGYSPHFFGGVDRYSSYPSFDNIAIASAPRSSEGSERPVFLKWEKIETLDEAAGCCVMAPRPALAKDTYGGRRVRNWFQKTVLPCVLPVYHTRWVWYRLIPVYFPTPGVLQALPGFL